MITEQDRTLAEDAVHATARIGVVDVKHGELAVPKRVLGHLLDGNVTVQLHRAGIELGRCAADLVTNTEGTFGKLTGIAWPDDVTPGTRVTVMCAKGAAGHDVAVQLPDLPESNVDWPDDDLPPAPAPVAEPEPEQDDESEDAEPEPDATLDARALRMHLASVHALANAFDLPAVDLDDVHQHDHFGPCGLRNHDVADRSYDEAKARAVAAEAEEADDEKPTSDADIDALVALLADQISADRHMVDTAQPGPGEYEVPTTLRLLPSADTPAEVIEPDWPVAEPESDEPAAAETTTIIPAAGNLPPVAVALTRAWSGFRRRLIPRRVVLLTAVVAVVVTWAVAWEVLGR